MSTTLKLTVPAMVDFLTSIGSSAQFVSLESVTQPKLKKTCPYVGVVKRAANQGWVNIDYKAKVERNIAKATGVPVKDVTYELGDVWFKHIMDGDKMTPVVVNKTKDDGKFYMFYFHRKTKQSEYFDVGGKKLSYSQLEPYFYASKPNEHKPAVRSICLNNLTKLKARGLIVVNKVQPVH